jgi:putative flippase GtrA
MWFVFTGATGVGLNLLITFVLTQTFFGPENYFVPYIIGSSVNLLYNFILHSILTFHTTRRHIRRFVFYILYSLASAAVQIAMVRTLVSLFGHEWYLLIIAGTILVLSLVTFLFFKRILFYETAITPQDANQSGDNQSM